MKTVPAGKVKAPANPKNNDALNRVIIAMIQYHCIECGQELTADEYHHGHDCETQS